MHDASRFERREVLGVPVHVLGEADVLEFVEDRIVRRAPAQIVTVNAEFVMLARRDRAFCATLRRAALSTPDGAGVVWAMRRHGAAQQGRVGGSDLIWSISALAAHRGHSVFLLGGASGVAAEAAERLRAAYSGLVVAGTYPGSPDPSHDEHIVDLIRRAGADILFVAFGAPDQEQWIERTLEATGVSIAMGVGGSLDYIAGRARRAPRWMQDRGLEWLWRLVRQPRRWRRMVALPRFAWLVLTSRESKRGD